MSARKLVMLSLLTGIALVIHVLEAQLPPIAPIPGIKLGLANIITLLGMALYSRRDAFAVLLLRIALGSLLTGHMASFAYSAAGGLVCFALMAAARAFLPDSQLWAVSITGAIGHNAGQLVLAGLILNSPQLFSLAPALIASAVVTGLFTGVCAQLTVKHIRKINLRLT